MIPEILGQFKTLPTFCYSIRVIQTLVNTLIHHMSIENDRRILIVEIQMFFHCIGGNDKRCFYGEVF